MTERCELANLQPGMILDQGIFDNDNQTLLEAGVVLTEGLIQMLRNRFSDGYLMASIRVPDQTAALAAAVEEAFPAGFPPDPNEDMLVDPEYVKLYNTVLLETNQLFTDQRNKASMDFDALGQFIAEGHINELCDGARAVTQLHNMTRDDTHYLLHHSIHVAVLAGLMGRWLRWPRSRQERLMLSGLFHSIGKLYMPADILDKPGKLTDQEQLTIHQYPEKGYEILCQSGLQGETEIVDGIRQHHERGDGSGYPHKRKMDKIGIFGRIIGILDVYDAMTANRVYAKRKSPFEAFDALLADMMAGKLDATYGVLFVKKVCQALIGSWVRLSNGKKAKIIYIDQSRTSALPIVETEDGNFWDIATKQGVSITCLLTYDELFTH